MMALQADAQAPAQFGFDLGALGGPSGLYALVISGAADWVDKGPQAITEGVRQQLHKAFSGSSGAEDWLGAELVSLRTEMRATFACLPNLRRPKATVLPGLWAAGDYVTGPYPATLEGAVRSGREAGRRVLAD
jgi:hypothetical protein